MKLRLLLVPVALVALTVVALQGCEVEECGDDGCGFGGDAGGDSGGSGGGNTGGSGGSTAGGGSAGETGDAGSTAQDLDCQADGTTEGSPTINTSPTAGCDACIWDICESEFSYCWATDPETSCLFGSTLYDGQAIEGEFLCMLECLKDIPLSDADRGEGDVGDCAALCGSSECSEAASPITQDLSLCMLGANPGAADPLGCQDECGFDL